MITSSATDLINGSLRLIGMLAEGEVPSSQTSNDALVALNQMLDSWSTESLNIFNTQDQVFNWPANEKVQTLGPTGDFVGNRPVNIDDSTYYIDASIGISFPIKIINQLQYDSIAVKNLNTIYPKYLWINMEYPNVSLTLYPVPNRVLQWHFISFDELTQPSTLSSTLAFPPGYLRAFRYNLAMELAPEFGVSVSSEVVKIANESKANIRRLNITYDVLRFPSAIRSNRSMYDIYTDSQT